MQFEQLSYLPGYLDEVLRLSHAPAVRLSRCAQSPLSHAAPAMPKASDGRKCNAALESHSEPTLGSVARSFINPPKTPVPLCAVLMHMGGDLFRPNQLQFRPLNM